MLAGRTDFVNVIRTCKAVNSAVGYLGIHHALLKSRFVLVIYSFRLIDFIITLLDHNIVRWLIPLKFFSKCPAYTFCLSFPLCSFIDLFLHCCIFFRRYDCHVSIMQDISITCGILFQHLDISCVFCIRKYCFDSPFTPSLASSW